MTLTGQSTATSSVVAKRSRRLRVIIILGSLSALAPLSIDAYLPGLPQLTESFGTTSAAAQLSLTGFVIGMSLGQLVIGPLSDTLGRRRPLVVGMAVYGAMSIVCAVAPNIIALDAVRFLQGFAGAAGVVIARAVVRDLFTGPAAARFFASLMLVNGLAPILAPVIGGQLLRWTDWRGIFLALAAIGIILAVGVGFGLPETLEPARRRAGGLMITLRTFWRLSHDRVLVGYALTTAFGFGALFAYISGSSFVLQDIYGLSPQAYSAVFAVNSLGIVVCAQVSGRLAHRVGSGRMLRIGLGVMLVGAATLVPGVLVDVGIIGILLGPFLIATSVGLVFPNAMVLALAEHGKDAGAASAMLGVLQFMVGGLVAPLVGVAGDGTEVPLALVMIGCAVASTVAWTVLARPRRRVVPAEA
ncbi:MAG: Bcr/CflA family multidrug efflux MFS transporter [Streptosporangiales bacterium]|nr:Bcr/CflA family multidrug efflux MFS transporter [Streptosporangiales bacterium]